MHQIDLRRIRKSRVLLHNMATGRYNPHMNVWSGSLPIYWHHHLRALVATLIFYGHQMEAMLVECCAQSTEWLLECLRPMAVLRKFGFIHFRSSSPRVHTYFRFLEARIMSNHAVPFRNWQEFRDQTAPRRSPYVSLGYTRGVPPPRTTDMTGEGVVKSEEEMEDAARTLYAILEIQDQMKPQRDL